MKNRMIFGLVGLSIFLIGLFLFLLLRPVNHPDFELPSHARIRNTAAIGAALSKYQFDHNGHLPNQLSELVPQYIPVANIRYFFWPLETNNFVNLSAEQLSREIDNKGSFIYLGKRGVEANMLLYQRTNLPTNQGMTNIMILTTNFTPALLSVEDIEARLRLLN